MYGKLKFLSVILFKQQQQHRWWWWYSYTYHIHIIYISESFLLIVKSEVIKLKLNNKKIMIIIEIFINVSLYRKFEEL